MSRLRTFIGIDLGKAIRDRVQALQEALARSADHVKWVEYDNLHLTLLFLGEVDDRELPAVCKAVSGVTQARRAFALSIETCGCFPNPRRPRVLWVGAGRGTTEVCALHDDLEAPLQELGCYRREERKYTPHVTMGRVRSERPDDLLSAALAKKSDWKGGETTVEEIRVMSSELASRGPIYTVLSRAQLG
jgi:2'-5' RNA ligase